MRVMCSHNVNVCLRMGLVEMAYTWRQISTMLAGVPGGFLPPLGQETPDVNVAAIVAGFEGGAGDDGAEGRHGRGAGWPGGEEENGTTAERGRGRSKLMLQERGAGGGVALDKRRWAGWAGWGVCLGLGFVCLS